MMNKIQNLLFLSVSLYAFLALLEVCGAQKGYLEKWKDHAFMDPSAAEEVSQFLLQAQTDFLTLDEKMKPDNETLNTLARYLEIRESWLKSHSLKNIILAGTITYAVNNAIAKLFVAVMDGLYPLEEAGDLLKFSKTSQTSKAIVFAEFDRVLTTTMHQHKTLSYHGSSALFPGRTKEWETYITQFGLHYRHEDDAIYLSPNVDKPQPNRNDLTLKQRDASHQASESS